MKFLKSKLFLNEKIDNNLKKFGSADEYYAFWVVDNNGNFKFALLTEREMKMAIDRGNKNPEDELPSKPMILRICNWLRSPFRK